MKFSANSIAVNRLICDDCHRLSLEYCGLLCHSHKQSCGAGIHEACSLSSERLHVVTGTLVTWSALMHVTDTSVVTVRVKAAGVRVAFSTTSGGHSSSAIGEGKM